MRLAKFRTLSSFGLGFNQKWRHTSTWAELMWAIASRKRDVREMWCPGENDEWSVVTVGQSVANSRILFSNQTDVFDRERNRRKKFVLKMTSFKSNFKSLLSQNKQHMFQDLTNNFLRFKLTSFLGNNIGKSPKTIASINKC